MLEVKNLSFHYGKERTLEDISFELEQGELVGLLGQNGVGKSTLFKCILGFLDYDHGEIKLGGRDLRSLSLKERARALAYIPQSHIPSFNHRVLDVVEMGANVRVDAFATPGPEERIKALEILEALGIGYLEKKGYREISGGERQLVLIARALMQEAQILIMDEPTANLDYGNQIRVLKVCSDLSSRGYTIFLSTHHPDQAFMFFNRVILLHDHGILGQGQADDVLTEANLKKIYGVDISVRKIIDGGEEKHILIPRI